MKRTLALAGAAALIATATITAPAQADPFGGSVRHYSPDGGYDAPIQVYCDGQWRNLVEGQHSDHICNDEDVNKIRVRNSGENIRCIAGTGWFQRLDGDKELVQNVAWFQNLNCVMDLD